jgi:hypothetical protein
MAVANSTRVFHRRVFNSSTCIRLQNDSITALSSPLEPTEATTS